MSPETITLVGEDVENSTDLDLKFQYAVAGGFRQFEMFPSSIPEYSNTSSDGVSANTTPLTVNVNTGLWALALSDVKNGMRYADAARKHGVKKSTLHN